MNYIHDLLLLFLFFIQDVTLQITTGRRNRSINVAGTIGYPRTKKMKMDLVVHINKINTI